MCLAGSALLLASFQTIQVDGDDVLSLALFGAFLVGAVWLPAYEALRAQRRDSGMAAATIKSAGAYWAGASIAAVASTTLAFHSADDALDGLGLPEFGFGNAVALLPGFWLLGAICTFIGATIAGGVGGLRRRRPAEQQQ